VVNFEVFLIVFDVGGRWSGGKCVRKNDGGFDGVKEWDVKGVVDMAHGNG